MVGSIPSLSANYGDSWGCKTIMAKITLATCQFPIDQDPAKNLRSVQRQLAQAKAAGAQLVHFSETSLSGYFGIELRSPRDMDWDCQRACMEQVQALARRYRLWVVIGANHRLTGKHKPHNSLYVIDGKGQLVDRYDKMFCTGRNRNYGDLSHYRPGEKFVTFDVRGVRCGLLICNDFRYPELFLEYKRRGVELMLVSFHNARGTKQVYDKYMIYVPPTLQSAAASNYFWISASNGTARHAWPSFVVDAEGVIIDRARPHRPAVLINTIDTKVKLYDASGVWRDRCMTGVLHSGTLVEDPRSKDRTAL